MTLLHIRRYVPADQDAAWNLHNLALQQAGVHVGNGPWDDDLQDIQGVYLNGDGEFLVGECEGQLVAMGAFRKMTTQKAEIKRMRVHPDFQRRGFGQAILSRLEAKAVEMGYTMLHLDTGVTQVPAQQLYLKNGFHEIGRTTFRGVELSLFEKALAMT